MNSRTVTLTALLSALIASAAVAADTYQIDAAHSSIGFGIEHMVINKVKGRFKGFNGNLTMDQGAVTAATVTIKAASIDTSIEGRDTHLRSADFFDVEKFPEISFKTKSIEKKDGQWIATGEFTMHGVTKTINLPFKVKGPILDPSKRTRLGISATTTLNRKDYGLTWSKALETGGLIVGEEVEIEIQAEAVKTESPKN